MPRTTPATALLGNTAGVSLLQGAYPAWISGGGNITLSGTSGTGGYTLRLDAGGGTGGGGGIALSAGTQIATTNTVAFADSNGITWGMSASTRITGSIRTDYASSSHSHGNPSLFLTNLTGTTASASNGLTLSLSAAAAGAGGGYPQALGYARI
jgi:hypothetical protein